ncbi:hypothetical protein JCM16303_003889 [Sporobolomyces ruberrimus]
MKLEEPMASTEAVAKEEDVSTTEKTGQAGLRKAAGTTLTKPEARKAARKSAVPPRPLEERQPRSKNQSPRRKPPTGPKNPQRSSTPLVKPRKGPPSDFRVENLPFPFTINLRLDHLEQVPLPSPCFVTHEFSLALRDDCQSSEQATPISDPFTIPEWLDSEGDSATNVALSSFDLDEYPQLPAPRSPGPLPQRSEILLRYRVLSVTNEILFEAIIPLSKGRRIERKGITKSKRSSNGGVAAVSWEIEDFGEISDEVSELDFGIAKKKLETRLQEFEKEWRQEVVEREKVEQIFLSETRGTPLPKPPTGFQKTASLMTDLDESSDSETTPSLLPPFLPIPKYEYVEFSNRAIPVIGQPLETFPYLYGWENTESTILFVDEQTSDQMVYTPDSDEDEEKVREEEAWKRLNMVSRRTLEGLKRGHVERDFAALEDLFQLLNVDRSELERRIQGGDMDCPEALRNEGGAVSDICRYFEKRLGISIDRVQQDARLVSEAEAVATESPIDFCEFCGRTSCDVHPSPVAYNSSPRNSTTSDPVLSASDVCPICADDSCRSRAVRAISFPSQPLNVELEESLSLLIKESPNLIPCTAAIALDRNVDQVIQHFPAPLKPQTAPPSVPLSVGLDLTNPDWHAQESDGYLPCSCCRNMQVRRGEPKATIFTISSCPDGGYGLAVLERAYPGDYFGSYAGEMFETVTDSWDSNGYGAWKVSWSERIRMSFWFDLDQQHSIDSQEIGNLTRYVNHQRKGKDNCGASITYVNGTHQIVLAATEPVDLPGVELFLDYGKEYTGTFQTTMPHFSLALMKGNEMTHYRTKSEIHAKHGRVKWAKHRSFSLLAQILSPLSTLFSIPALSEHWYISRDANGMISESKPDPPLIITAGSILLALSLLSNSSILLRLVDVHCRLFTVTTLILLFTHILLALVTVTIFAVEHAVPDGYSLSTAFWLTVASASIALGVAISLIIDGVRTKWYSRGGTGLTGEQRSLVLVFNIFVVNIIVGATAYRYLIAGATFLDSTYFTVQCFITVGFGDVLPESVGARAFTIAFLTFGILNFAILLAFIRSTALEAVKERYKARERRTLERIKTRHSAIVNNYSKRGAFMIYVTCGLWRPKNEVKDDPIASETKETRSDWGPDGKYAYEKKIEELNSEQRLEFRSQLVVATIGVILTWLLGALVFMHLEGWSYWIAFYFCYISMSTLGLGDYAPSTQGGRAFFCIWALIGAGILTVFFSVIADGYSAHYKETFQRNFVATFQRKHRHAHHPPAASPTTQLVRQSETMSRSDSGSHDTKKGESHVEKVEHAEETEHHVRHRKRKKRKERVTDLLSQTKNHLQHLATRDSGDSETVDFVVRKVMDEEEFEIRNRELVEQDRGLKEFIFLRNLLTRFDELETLTNELLDESIAVEGEHKSEPTPNHPPPSSRVIQYSDSVEEKPSRG